MQNAALAAAGIPLRYELLDVPPAAIEAAVASLASEHAAGNVTIPHKEAAARLMKSVSPVVERIGAVNTFHTTGNGDLAGDNTDPVGFGAFVRATLGHEPRDAHFAIIGAGGAAAAVLATIERWPGCRAGIYSRNRARADRLVARFSDVARTETLSEDEPVRGEIVINATPIGLESDDLPVSLEQLDRDASVLDLAYKVGETAWVRLARAEGRIASDGLPMLLEQGAAAFEIWFGVQPDRDVMWTALKAATGRQ
ncbi:MAG: shikimate dehydrogenase [Gemmatimonadota bacterium]|nr:shikimate dehydrogenase [Gemmatimonadota bacterium]